MKTKFLFDLDGTITKQETLPLIAAHFHIEEEIQEMTQKTIAGNLSFVESFIQRVYLLGKLPVNEICALLSNVSLYEKLAQFIHEHHEDCAIVTNNIAAWTSGLIEKIGCKAYTSQADVVENKVQKLTLILRKEGIVQKYQSAGYRVVFIGDGNNDAEAMRTADISITTGTTHFPALSTILVADYMVVSEDSLCRLLHQLL